MATNANTDIYDKAVNRAAMIRLYERRVNGQVEVVLNDHEAEVESLIKGANLSKKGSRALTSSLDRQIEKTYTNTTKITQSSLLDLAKDQMSFTYQSVEASMGKLLRVQRPTRQIAEEIVLKRPLHNDRTLEQGWAGVSVGERVRLASVIRRGIASGKTAEEIAVDVRKGNVHKISMNQSKALVVTSITSVQAQADHAVYEANEKAIEGWQYVAVLDSRTTPICASRDGKIFPVGSRAMLPPAHYHCRSTTIPVFKSWGDIDKLENVAEVRKQNIKKLTQAQREYYDGQTPHRETYSEWLLRQPKSVQLAHLGEVAKVDLFRSGSLLLDKFTNDVGNSIGIRELRALSDSGYTLPGDTQRFAKAKAELDALKLPAMTPDDFYKDPKMRDKLLRYYELQAGDLDGTLSLANYRGITIGAKRGVKRRVLSSPPSEAQLVYNPLTGRYDDSRLYRPNAELLQNNLRLTNESSKLLPRDKAFINDINERLSSSMSLNQRAAVVDNLRVTFSRFRENGEVWGSFKGVSQSQIGFDVMNASDFIETQLRSNNNVLKKLLQDNYIDPVLGPVQLDDLGSNLVKNIRAKNLWEDRTAPKIANELRPIFKNELPLVISDRVSDKDLHQFYLRFAHRLALNDGPDKDSLAVGLGRDLYNLANLNGRRGEWHELGTKILESKRASKFFTIDTFGVQKRRMKSRLSNNYFGPYYDTQSFNIRVTDPRIIDYSKTVRKVDLGMRVGVTDSANRLVIRKGYKTYFHRGPLGLEDTRIPITSTSAFSDFPEEFIDDDLAKALNWASKSEYRIDKDYYDFTNKLLNFQDDRGKAKHYSEVNEYRKYISSRGDAYERFKAMEWLRKKDASFSNHPFIDHRGRIYERGLIGPQSGETFRPFLNTKDPKNFSPRDFGNYQDQIGSFLGGLSDAYEGKHNSLTIKGRQAIAEKWRADMVDIGNKMLSGKPADLRAILDSEFTKHIDGEELGKFYRLALESAKIDRHLGGDYSAASLEKLRQYKISLALEQDASSSGAQIIAITTKNKRLAELSNVVPTTQKRRLYDEIASATYNDPRFRKLNERLNLTEKDLRKAAKAQNMVTFYGAGERTGILNVEGKLAGILGKNSDTLVVRASDRDVVLNEIDARIARIERFDKQGGRELRALRQNVRDIFNKGLDPGDSMMEELHFLDPRTKDLVEKMGRNYEKVVTPNDFKEIAGIMSEHLAEEVPILKDFTKFFGRLAESYLETSKPSKADFDWEAIAKTKLLGQRKGGYVLPDNVSQILGIKAGEPVSEKILRRFDFWDPNSNLADIIYGVKAPETRRTGGKYFKVEILDTFKIHELELFYANKMPKSWTNVPWVNFDGKIIEQNFTQTFEERLAYKDKNGNWVNNILQVPQKTEASWWDQVINKSGKINDIADATKARTAFAVNGNHSNDATLVKQFHMWGEATGTPTSTVHDAFFTNAADMLQAKDALRKIYARALKGESVKKTLDELRARGLPQEKYNEFLQEAIDKGLIPVVGKSRVGGRLMSADDILTTDDILKEVPDGFADDTGWYGIG
jgi:SPP1 gp7 family putative phage head morphogenesis protein